MKMSKQRRLRKLDRRQVDEIGVVKLHEEFQEMEVDSRVKRKVLVCFPELVPCSMTQSCKGGDSLCS